MESSADSEITSVDEEFPETCSLITSNGSSGADKKSEVFSEINDFEESEDTRSELKFDAGERLGLILLLFGPVG